VSPAERAENLRVIRSPAAGKFYRIPAPGDDPYVEIGDAVRTKQVLCFIDTMEPIRNTVSDLPAGFSGDEVSEVHYEVEAEVSGEVVDILVEESADVEPGQPLFYLLPEE
jgi:acetyl-CoA carboxylase biotin carboxyl carrier protein